MLDWYRNQEQLDFVNDGSISRVGFVNAVTRSAAELLGHSGYKVMFMYPDQEVTAIRANCR